MTHGQWFFSFISARCLIRGEGQVCQLCYWFFCHIWKVEPWQQLLEASAKVDKPASDELNERHCFGRDTLQCKLRQSQEAGSLDLWE